MIDKYFFIFRCCITINTFIIINIIFNETYFINDNNPSKINK